MLQSELRAHHVDDDLRKRPFVATLEINEAKERAAHEHEAQVEEEAHPVARLLDERSAEEEPNHGEESLGCAIVRREVVVPVAEDDEDDDGEEEVREAEEGDPNGV